MPRSSILSMGFALVATSMLAVANPASAADGEILITHAKALAGGVTPGDSPGYPVTLSAAGSYKFATIAGHLGPGIICGSSCHIEGNVVSGNTGNGILIRSGTILGNTIIANWARGIAATSDTEVGFGNNTIVDNNRGGAQVLGPLVALEPNVCAPVAC